MDLPQLKDAVSESGVNYDEIKETEVILFAKDSIQGMEKIMLLRKIIELQEKIIIILQQKSLLKDLKCEIHEEKMMNDSAQNVNEVVEQEKVGKSLSNEKYKIIQETFDSFVKYREACKKCLYFVNTICNKAMTKIHPDTSQSMSDSLTLEKKFEFYNKTLEACKITLTEFESLIYPDLRTFDQEKTSDSKKKSDEMDKFADAKKFFHEINPLNQRSRVYNEEMRNEGENGSDVVDNKEVYLEEFYNKIEFLNCAIEKAELAYDEMKSAIFKVINIHDF